MEKLRIAIIDVGDMGTGHCIVFDRLPNCEITWICDPNPDNVERAMGYIQ